MSGVTLLIIGIPFLLLSILLAALYFFGAGLLGAGAGVLGNWINELVPQTLTEIMELVPGAGVLDAADVIGSVVDGATFLIFRWIRGFIFLEIAVNILLIVLGIASVVVRKKPKKAMQIMIFAITMAVIVIVVFVMGFSVILLTAPRIAVLLAVLTGAILNLVFMRKRVATVVNI